MMCHLYYSKISIMSNEQTSSNKLLCYATLKNNRFVLQAMLPIQLHFIITYKHYAQQLKQLLVFSQQNY